MLQQLQALLLIMAEAEAAEVLQLVVLEALEAVVLVGQAQEMVHQAQLILEAGQAAVVIQP
jgi:hypothetical protein